MTDLFARYRRVPRKKARNLRRTPRAGEWAGYLKPDGYWYVELDGEEYRADRIVYALHHGVDVPGEMDVEHIDGDTQNNDPRNLRLVPFDDEDEADSSDP